MSSLKNPDFKTTKDNNFSMKITLSSPENLLIRCYDLKKLSNSYFEKILSKSDIEKISKEEDINKFYDKIKTGFENDLYEIIKNNNSITIKLNEKIQLTLTENSISDINEYNYILCQCINLLKENILNIQENLMKNISEISIEKMKKDDEHTSINEKIKIIKEENITIGEKLIDLEKENENNKNEINYLKVIINKLSSQKKKKSSKNYPKKEDLISDYNSMNNIYSQHAYENTNPYYNSSYDYYSNLQNYYYPNSNYNNDKENDINENDYYDDQFNYSEESNTQNTEDYNNNYYSQNLNLMNGNKKYYKYSISEQQYFGYESSDNLRKNTEDDKNSKNLNSEKNNNISSEYNAKKFNSTYKSTIKDNKIRKLDLGSRKIGNIILSELPKYGFRSLTKLYLSDNEIDNINDLVLIKNENLEKLYLSSNKIKDISVLSRVKFNKLNNLYLNNNLIFDISILSKVNFPHMKNLSFHSNEISNIDVLEFVKFKELQYLSLHGNKISDIAVFKRVKFPDLNTLYLYNNKIKDLTVFDRSKFKKLKCFHVFDNCIDEKSNLKVIEDLKEKINYF